MLAVRIHLDPCTEQNGALRVIPGSHLQGRVSAKQVVRISASPAVSCAVAGGGVLLMRPLLLHASSACQSPRHRRVIHLEFAARALPGGLAWYSKIS
jgi:ectoine hydroxylase-related dioxygenase (phytanoyl-CoA dioxygenase family)